MKVTIEHSKTKRHIDGVFGMCLSRNDLTTMVRQLEAKLQDEKWSYGWVTVYPSHQFLKDTPAKPWDDI